MQCRYLMNGLLSEVQNQYPREQLHGLSDDHDVEVPAVCLSELKVSLSAVSVSEVGYIYIYICQVQVCQRWYQHAQKCST